MSLIVSLDKVAANTVDVVGGKSASLASMIHGLKDLKQWFSEFYDAFPDVHWAFDDRFLKGDKVVTRMTLMGTHTGEYMGIPPTNKKWTGWAISIFRRAGGQIVEEWIRSDTLGLMRQLGAIPTPKAEP